MIDGLLDVLLDARIASAQYRDFLVNHRAKGVDLVACYNTDIGAGHNIGDAMVARRDVCEDLAEIDAELIIERAKIAHIDCLLAR